MFDFVSIIKGTYTEEGGGEFLQKWDAGKHQRIYKFQTQHTMVQLQRHVSTRKNHHQAILNHV